MNHAVNIKEFMINQVMANERYAISMECLKNVFIYNLNKKYKDYSNSVTAERLRRKELKNFIKRSNDYIAITTKFIKSFDNDKNLTHQINERYDLIEKLYE